MGLELRVAHLELVARTCLKTHFLGALATSELRRPLESLHYLLISSENNSAVRLASYHLRKDHKFPGINTGSALCQELDEGEPGESASSKKPKKSLGSLKDVLLVSESYRACCGVLAKVRHHKSDNLKP